MDITERIEIEYKIYENNNEQNKTLKYYGSREDLDNYVPFIFHPILAIIGLSVNIIVATVIAGNRSMRTASNCYVFSIIFSDFVVLSDITINVFRRWLNLKYLQFDGSYIDCVIFESTVLTIVIFALERYIVLCPLKTKSFNFENGIKTILVIWSIAATFPAMELNLNLHFLPVTQSLIYLMSTVMFLILPTFLILTLTAFIMVDKKNLININVDHDASKVFVCLTIIFYLSMAPYRILSLLHFMTPTYCCPRNLLNGSYLIVELSAAVNPILYGFVSNNFRTAFKETLGSFCVTSSNQSRNDDHNSNP